VNDLTIRFFSYRKYDEQTKGKGAKNTTISHLTANEKARELLLIQIQNFNFILPIASHTQYLATGHKTTGES
jgi:hypothetical protein